MSPLDRSDPEVGFEAPDSGQRVAAGDSVLVQVQVEDDQGISEVELSGVALRGSAQLGTLTAIPRFIPKSVSLDSVRPVVRDTVLTRFLLPTGDSVPADTVLLIARVRDRGGNVSADTLRIAIGGPRVQIVAPIAGTEVRPGAQLQVRLAASDTVNRIQSLRLNLSGATTRDTLLTFDSPRFSVDTIVALTIPEATGTGQLVLRATARNTVNDSTISPPIPLQVLPPAADTQAPEVHFRVTAPARAEQRDAVSVTVAATDEIRVDRVGVTLLTIHRLATGTDTLSTRAYTASSDSATFRIDLSDLDVPVPKDTSTVRVEVTAFAYDSADNCATATVVNTEATDACVIQTAVFGVRPGARYDILMVRGRTLAVGASGDRIVDLVADDAHLFLSNFSKNRLEVLPIGTTSFLSPISVGSRPWGLAFNQANSRLYVANSGGTNLSVVSPSTRSEVSRIQTPNVKLYDVEFEAAEIPNPNDASDTISANFPASVQRFDYSDRPQFVGITQNENVVYSTVPTAAAEDGTVRIYHNSQDRLEMVTDYAEDRIGSKVVITNADSAFLVPAEPNNLLEVCPRNRSENPALDRNLPVACYVGSVGDVESTIRSMGYDTEFLYSLNIEEIGLSDTTFIAVSGDHSTVAVGEGARSNGRVVAFVDPAGQVNGPLVKYGEIRDLVGNAAERVTGLALNSDGSLGLARGSEAFFFSTNLRLQGFVQTESGAGGVEIHPDNPGVARAFVPGVQPDGLAFIDVMDTSHFVRLRRIFVRDPIVGPIRAVRAPDGTLKLYAITAAGLVSVDVLGPDL